MASSSILLSFIFLLFLIYYPQVQVQGRESKFFSKSTLNTDNNNISSSINTTTLTNTTTTTANNNNTVKDAKQEEVPISFTSDTHNGYGLYGHGSSDQFPPATTNINNPHDTYTDITNKTPAKEYTGASYDEFKEFNKAYSKNWFGTKQQGMSDTRFIGNGRYFYDVDNMNSDSKEYPSMNVYNEGFGSSRVVTTGKDYDENASDNDFNNYIGESQLYEEELQGSQEEYVP